MLRYKHYIILGKKESHKRAAKFVPAEEIRDMVKVIYENFVQIVASTTKILVVANCTVFQNIVEERQYHIQLYHSENRSILPFPLKNNFLNHIEVNKKLNNI